MLAKSVEVKFYAFCFIKNFIKYTKLTNFIKFCKIEMQTELI